MLDIFDRIRATLNGQPKSGDIATVIALTKAAIADQAAWRVEYQTTAEDPLVPSDVADAAAEKLIKSRLASTRLMAALDRLDPQYAAALHDEHQARITPVYEKARTKRAALLAEFRHDYPRHVQGIVDLLHRMRDMDRDTIETLQMPAGREHLSALRSEIPAIIDQLRLPELDRPDAFAWGEDPNRVMTVGEQSRAFSRHAGTWP